MLSHVPSRRADSLLDRVGWFPNNGTVLSRVVSSLSGLCVETARCSRWAGRRSSMEWPPTFKVTIAKQDRVEMSKGSRMSQHARHGNLWVNSVQEFPPAQEKSSALRVRRPKSGWLLRRYRRRTDATKERSEPMIWERWSLSKSRWTQRLTRTKTISAEV